MHVLPGSARIEQADVEQRGGAGVADGRQRECKEGAPAVDRLQSAGQQWLVSGSYGLAPLLQCRSTRMLQRVQDVRRCEFTGRKGALEAAP